MTDPMTPAALAEIAARAEAATAGPWEELEKCVVTKGKKLVLKAIRNHC